MILYCEECGERMKPSHPGYVQTLVGYFSPPGHDHDDNCKSKDYKCVNGHLKVIFLRNKCSNPECDWKGKETCFCHKGNKTEGWPE